MKRSLLLVFLFTGISFLKVTAQSCFNVSAGPDVYTSCLNTCFDFKAKVPDVRTTDDYKVIPITYDPFPYTNISGVEFNSAYLDDNYSGIINLPFTFCFFGKNYAQCVVGTNGVLTFEKANANTDNAYIINNTAPQPGGMPGNPPDMQYYPRASIMGPYHDIDPDNSSTTQTAGRKMEYIIVGSAPCRKFILNFYKIPYYACPSALVTQQMVLYEGTGIIDIFLESKPSACAASTNSGKAILGIQNWEQDKAVTVPGRNATNWSAAREGWRFVPNGGTSLLNRVELYKGGTLISTGTTVDLGTGELEATFQNICQSEDSTGYVIKAFYKKCDDLTQETEGSDSISVIKTLNPLSLSSTATSCPASADGTITVNSPVGANIEYSIDGGVTWQTSPTFTVAGGSYEVIARVIGSTCTGKATTIVTSAPVVSVTTGITSPNCPGTATGSITVSFPNASGTEYSIDGGVTWQTSPVFSGLAAGNYTIDVRLNPSGCTGSTPATITDPAPMSITAAPSPVLCNGTATGTINISNPVGADYEYSIDGGTTWQASNVFAVPAGSYTITVRRISTNCTNTQTATVTEPPALTATATDTKTASCANNDGELTVTASGGVPPYEYSINNGTGYQPSNIFTGLATGTYSQNLVRDANNCVFTVNPVTIALNDTMRLELGPDTSICAGSSVTLMPQTNDLTNVFNWSPATGLSSAIIKNPVASPVDTIMYTLNATWGICSRTDNITVNVKHKPQVYAGRDTTICFNTDAFLHGTVSNLSGTVNYAWTPAAGLVRPDTIQTIAHPDSTQIYTLTVTDNYSCSFSVSDDIKVTVNPEVVAFAGNDTNAIINRPHQLRATGGVSYTWAPAAPLNSAFIPNPLAILKNDTYFTVTARDNIGCTDTDDIFVKVYDGPEYYVPNAFTPNGDGLNDVFRPIPVGMRSTEYFRVFDRYGKLVFETREWLKGWDGKIKGKAAPLGTYVWTIKGVDTNGRAVDMKGTVVLLK